MYGTVPDQQGLSRVKINQGSASVGAIGGPRMDGVTCCVPSVGTTSPCPVAHRPPSAFHPAQDAVGSSTTPPTTGVPSHLRLCPAASHSQLFVSGLETRTVERVRPPALPSTLKPGAFWRSKRGTGTAEVGKSLAVSGWLVGGNG